MRTHDELIAAFISPPSPQSPDDVVKAILKAAERLGFTSADEKARLTPLLITLRDYSLAQAVDEARNEREEPSTLGNRLESMMSPSGIHRYSVLANSGIPVADNPKQLFRAFGTLRRPLPSP